jgi:hypothetical protein
MHGDLPKNHDEARTRQRHAKPRQDTAALTRLRDCNTPVSLAFCGESIIPVFHPDHSTSHHSPESRERPS